MTQPNSTPRVRPVIRVFVSSTFSDMKHERNALQERVFPELEKLCQEKEFQFQAIDLRWGVSTEAGLDHRTMRICFDELRRAQEISPEPNFLVLLGDRYGWRPLPEAISAMEFEALKKAATTDHPDDTDKHRSEVKDQKSEGRSPSVIREIHEIRGQELDPLAVLNAWYRCDENILLPDPPETDPNHIPLNYILQPRTRNLGDGRDYTRRKDDPTKDTQDWLDVQQVLWRLINTAFPADARWFDGVDWARHLAEVNDPQHPKRAIPQFARFQASATEQEIWCGALSAANSERHVIACFREISNRDDFPIAEVKDFFDRTDSGEFDEAAVARQTALKEAIRLRLGENKPVPIPFTRLKRANGKVLVDSSEADTQAFCDALLARFRPIIERQIEEYWNKSAKGSTERAGRELEIERDEHRRFGRERGGSESFVGRETELEAIRDYLRSESRLPLVVHGASGCGKTALLARAVGETQKSVAGGQWLEVIVRFIGVTPRSSDVRSLLGSLCQELRLRHPREGELPADTKALREELHEQFRAATLEQPLILFMDALDQLSDADGGRLLNWIPAGQMPSHVKLVVSCLSDQAKGDPAGQPFAELTRRQLPAKHFVNLDALSEDEAGTLLFDRWLPQAGRTVSREQRERIRQRLKSEECRQPIYLKLLFEEARLWRSYDKARSLGRDVPKMLARFFVRLRRPGNHGRLLVNRVLGYLAASRHGLAENEILEVLFADREYKAALDQATEQTRHELPASATRIPIAIWSRLRFDLAPYLTERSAPGANVLTFYHRQVAEWLQEHYAEECYLSWQPARRILAYFSAQSYFLESVEKMRIRAARLPCTARPTNIRKVQEVTYQQMKLLSRCLPSSADFAFECARLESLLTDPTFLEAKNEAGLVAELHDDLQEGLRLLPRDRPTSQILRRICDAVRQDFQFIVRHHGDLPQGLFQSVWNYLCPQKFADALNQEGKYQSHINSPEGKTSEERLDFELFRFISVWRELRAVTCPRVPWVRLKCPSAKTLSASPASYLLGHSAAVMGVALSHDGRICISGSADTTLRVWDLLNIGTPTILKGHTGLVIRVVAEAHGNRCFSASHDGSVRSWDLATLTPLTAIQIRRVGAIDDLAISGNGTLLAACCFDRVVLMDPNLSIRVEIPAMPMHHGTSIERVALSPDGCLLACATGELDATNWISVWDTTSNDLDEMPWTHDDAITTLCFLDNGTLASGSQDGIIKIGNIRSGAVPLSVSVGGWVHAVERWIDDSHLLVATNDELLLIEIIQGTVLNRERLHTQDITGVCVNRTAQRIATSSWDHRLCSFHAEQLVRGSLGADKALTWHSLKLSCDGTLMAAERRDCISLFNTQSLRRIFTFDDCANDHFDSECALSGSGKLIAYRLRDVKAIVIRHLDSGDEMQRLTWCSSPIAHAAMSNDGLILLAASVSGEIWIYDTSTGNALWNTAVEEVVGAVAVSEDGSWFAWSETGIRNALSVCKLNCGGQPEISKFEIKPMLDALGFSSECEYLFAQAYSLSDSVLLRWRVLRKEHEVVNEGRFDLRCFAASTLQRRFTARTRSPEIEIIDIRNGDVLARLPNRIENLSQGSIECSWVGLEDGVIQGFQIEVADGI